jgi:type IV pilus assembly protein PilA
MQNRLAELRRRRAAGESGFTLIELLVVVVIIGILIAIAIPVYLNYQKGAKDKSAASDLRNAIAVLEQCNSDNGTYPSAVGLTGGSLSAAGCAQTINVSSGTNLSYSVASPATTYEIWSTNTGGSGKAYCYNSQYGGSIKAESTAFTSTVASVGSPC